MLVMVKVLFFFPRLNKPLCRSFSANFTLTKKGQQSASQAASPVVMTNSSGQPSSTQYHAQSQSTPASQPASVPQTPHRRRRREGGPDWKEFYKNGPPEEIIVIVDDDEVPPAIENTNPGHTTTTYSTQIPRRSGTTQAHSAKRRRTGDESTYEVRNHDQPPWTNNPAPEYHGEPSDTSMPMPIAAVNVPAGQPSRRTTTRPRGNTNTAARAPPAVGNVPFAQHGVGHGTTVQQPPRARVADVSQVTTATATGRSATRTAGASTTTPITPGDCEAEPTGQKRKRQTRKTVRDEQKRLEMEATQALQAAGGIMDYIPPAKPPYKAGEVKVNVIPDTTGQGRVDETDGHYAVEEGAQLAGRCKCTHLVLLK